MPTLSGGGPKITVTVQHPAPAASRGPGQGAGKPPAVKSAGTQGGANATVKPPAAPKQTMPKAPASFNPLAGTLSSAQLGGLSNRLTNQYVSSQLGPLRAQAGQIANSERTVSGQVGGAYQTADQIQQGIQANAGAGALTDENAAAQAASNTANSIDQTGAAARALNGGYLDPNVAAALQTQRTQLGTDAGAEAGFANSQGQNEADFMANLRGSTALQAAQARGNVAGYYQKDLATNQADQDKVIAQSVPYKVNMKNDLGQQQFTDVMTAKGLGVKLLTADANAVRANATGRAALINAQTGQEKAATAAYLAKNKVGVDWASLNEKQSYDAANVRIREMTAATGARNATEKQRHDLQTESLALRKFLATTQASGTTPAGRKIASEITGNAAYYEQLVASGKVPPKTAALAVAKGAHTDGTATAAIELATKGYITQQTASQLAVMGFTVPPAWLQPKSAANAGSR